MGDGTLAVASPLLVDAAIGASVSINGVCLTVVDNADGVARFDVVPETLDRTNLGGLDIGDLVNLELAMPATGRFDGHVVQGHVDGLGVVRGMKRLGDSAELTVAPPPALERYLVEKGSVAVDGVSLTVADLRPGVFTVALIPYTLSETNLADRRPGDKVSLEADVIAKYVERLLAQRER